MAEMACFPKFINFLFVLIFIMSANTFDGRLKNVVEDPKLVREIREKKMEEIVCG